MATQETQQTAHQIGSEPLRQSRGTALFVFTHNFGDLERATEDPMMELSDYTEPVISIGHLHRGCVDQIQSRDTTTIFFGTHSPSISPEADAVSAALSMREAIEGVTRKRTSEVKPTLRMGIALQSGSILHGDIGGKDILRYTFIGKPVTACWEMRQLTDSGDDTVPIILGDNVYAKVADAVEVQEIPNPVPVYRMIGRKS